MSDIKFDFEEVDNKAIARAVRAFTLAEKEFERHKHHWGDKGGQAVETWNPSIKEVGENFCDAIVHLQLMHFRVNTNMRSRVDMTKNALKLLERIADTADKIITKGVSNETNSRWRTAILIGLLNKVNQSSEIVKLRLRKSMLENNGRKRSVILK
jgi:hypothetical protein